MSADNFFVYGKFPDGWRIGMARMSDYNPNESSFSLLGTSQKQHFLKSVFGESKVYSSDDEALDAIDRELERIEDGGGYVEYGTQLWKHLESW